MGRLIVADDESAALALLLMTEHLFEHMLSTRCVRVTRWNARRLMTWEEEYTKVLMCGTSTPYQFLPINPITIACLTAAQNLISHTNGQSVF